MSEDTRLYLSMTRGWNHPLWSQICLLLSWASCFFSILYPSISPLPRQSPGRTSLFHSVKKRGPQYLPASSSLALHSISFFLFFPPQTDFHIWNSAGVFRCTAPFLLTGVIIQRASHWAWNCSFFSSIDFKRFWNIHVLTVRLPRFLSCSTVQKQARQVGWRL